MDVAPVIQSIYDTLKKRPTKSAPPKLRQRMYNTQRKHPYQLRIRMEQEQLNKMVMVMVMM